MDETEIHSDLSTATAEELWVELKTRYSACVLIYEKLEKDASLTTRDYGMRNHGGYAARIGLIQQALWTEKEFCNLDTRKIREIREQQDEQE